MNRASVALAILAVLLLLASGPGTRMGLWNFRTGIILIQAAAVSGLISLVVSVISLVMAKRQALALPGAVIGALVVSLGLLVFLGSIVKKAKSLPMIHDITTDTVDPPAFVAIIPLREGSANSAIYEGKRIADLQK